VTPKNFHLPTKHTLTQIEAGSRLCARRAALMPIAAAFLRRTVRQRHIPQWQAHFFWGARILIHKKTPAQGETKLDGRWL